MASSTRIFFRVVYRTFYFFLHLLLLALLLVSPGDIINQSRQRHDIVSILIVSASYVASVLITVFVFFLRIYMHRGVLNSIPRSWVPVEKGDVRSQVRKMISAGLSRSAAIAFVSRPRIVPEALLAEMCPMADAGGAFMSGGGGGDGAAEGVYQQLEGEKDGAADDVEAVNGGAGGMRQQGSRIVRFKRAEMGEKEKVKEKEKE